MSSKIKLYIGRKIIDSLPKTVKYTPSDLLPLMHIRNSHPSLFELQLPFNSLEDSIGITNVNAVLKIPPDDIIKGIKTDQDRANRTICFEIENGIFIKDVLENCSAVDLSPKPKKMVVEFSSPNIAKPFHLGHLRSTIIGNFISNLSSSLHQNVTKLNYLGDWGTQFGFIKIGVEGLKRTKDEIRQNPLKLLYEAYVHANKLAETDPEVAGRARASFSKLEQDEGVNEWKQYLEYSKKDLANTYKRLGVEFDEYNFESSYTAKNVADLIAGLLEKRLAVRDNEGKIVVDLDNNREVPILKSDGTTLYLTRDMAAAIERFDKYKFDRMLYVVDNSQSEHFKNLKGLLHKMHYPWVDRLQHVKFGRIRGLSSRKGSALFLNDILDNCRELMVEKQKKSPNTRVSLNNTEVSDILGVSCVIVNDLKQRRQKDYDFDWDKVLQVQGDTGVKLQYTHCRLYSLERNAGVNPADVIMPEFLSEPEALILIRELAQFQEVLYKANAHLEAYILVKYLFHLCNHISKAFKVLKVKSAPPEVAGQRLALFQASKSVLHKGMSILGLRPLNEM